MLAAVASEKVAVVEKLTSSELMIPIKVPPEVVVAVVPSYVLSFTVTPKTVIVFGKIASV